jgi:UDP-N-acetylmuramoylalanine--D-glutamate ligase
MELNGRRVTIMGLGLHGGGVGAARYCAQAGAIVTVTDLADERALGSSLAMLPNIPIANFKLGGHREEDFHYADAVVVNPAVRPGNKFVELARRGGAQITSEIELFLDACPVRVIGVTGTVGKSTTASMLAAILKIDRRRVWLGGNIGHSLLMDLANTEPHDVVLELSSFQLQWLNDKARWPSAAIVTNCTPNHLDWHGSWASYVAAKQRLLSHLPAKGICVVDTQDPEVSCWQELCKHACHNDRFENLPALQVPGEHNRRNAELAARMAAALGVPRDSIVRGLTTFRGLPHRLSFVGFRAGRRFYNDSKSTSPAATLAAIAAMDRPTWLLLGGADSLADFAPLADQLPKLCRGAAVFGTVAPKLSEAIQTKHRNFRLHTVDKLSEAFDWCVANSQPGDAILLSPGCPSTDQFRDFARRGKVFEELVGTLPENP